MLTILIKAYCANVAVDIKPIYLSKRYLFKIKVARMVDLKCLDKIYFCFTKLKLSKRPLYKLN